MLLLEICVSTPLFTWKYMFITFVQQIGLVSNRSLHLHKETRGEVQTYTVIIFDFLSY